MIPSKSHTILRGFNYQLLRYLELNYDYPDLKEKIDYFSSNDNEAREIIHNPTKHDAQFLIRKLN